MKTKLNRLNRGFTIIEVLIVLAIAGLILLIVLLAIPALQRNSRNTTRNNEAARIVGAITECLANRQGTIASCDTAAETPVGTLQALTLDPTFSTGGAALGTGTTTDTEVGYERTCNAAGSDDVAGGPREFAVMFQVESGGATPINRCVAG